MSKKSDLIHLVNSFKPFAFALSETWLKPGALFRVSGYSCLREDRPDGYGGVALLIRNSVLFSSVYRHSLRNPVHRSDT